MVAFKKFERVSGVTNLSFARPEFSVIIGIIGHFFSETTRKEIIRDALKALEVLRTAFKRMFHFFTGDNLIITLCSVLYNFTDWKGLCGLISNLKNQI